MDGTAVVFLASTLIVGALIFAVITLSRKPSKKLNVDEYRSRWLAIERQLIREDTASHQLTVLNADKLLDHSMCERGIAGETMGERMKQAKDKFSDRNGVWAAHKLRNQIAHEPDVAVTYEQARRALASFKKALKDMGAI